MKKILTLFVMFLAAWNIMCAQTPVLGYEAVVRDTANMPVPNTSVLVTISVMNGGTTVYQETQTQNTNAVGMVSILVGMGSPTGTFTYNSLNNVDWTTASILVEYQVAFGETSQTLQSDAEDILPVPYALSADRIDLTTEMIAGYLANSATTVNDYSTVMQALQDNENENNQAGALAARLKDKLVNYIKSRKDLAVEVAAAWLASADSDDVMWAYNALTNNQDAFNAGVDILVNVAKNNKSAAIDILTHYLSQTTPDDVNEVIDSISNREADIWAKVVEFAKTHRHLAMHIVNEYLGSATPTEMKHALKFFNENIVMKNAFVYGRFYSYLDEYLPAHYNISRNGLTDEQIRSQVNTKLDEADAEHKYVESDCDIDICNMRDKVENDFPGRPTFRQ